MGKVYTIENITEEELDTIAKALDMYMRVGLLQFESVITDDILFGNLGYNYNSVRSDVEYHLYKVSTLLYKSLKPTNIGGGLGIRSQFVSKSAKISHDIYSLIKYTQYTNKYENVVNPPYSVYSYQPLHVIGNTIKITSSSDRLSKIKEILDK